MLFVEIPRPRSAHRDRKYTRFPLRASEGSGCAVATVWRDGASVDARAQRQPPAGPVVDVDTPREQRPSKYWDRYRRKARAQSVRRTYYRERAVNGSAEDEKHH